MSDKKAPQGTKTKESAPTQPEQAENQQNNPTEMLDEQWLSLTQDWQAQPFEKTDMAALVKQTKRRTYGAKSMLALDVIATISIFVMFIYGFFADTWSTPTQVFLFCGGIGSVIFVYYEFKIRLNTWQQNCGSPDKALEQAIASCQSSIKYIKLIKLWSWIMVPGMNWYLYIVLQESEKSPWSAVIVVNLIMLVTWLVSHVFHQKRLKELARLSQLSSANTH